ncbi:hypothetical protein NQ315_011714 [Exocentrus adspersus]|uniref:Nicotinamide-nucleotide adenylyltransferase n=1 Tax=Exocentrus adspersus TaxID=1586481 RepID=A0AAV8W1Z2_9CUCU|nr:hypothetical protein NQ315_011714 [Exocentrus adspersus]
MAPTKVILLACGAFNPPTNMHLRMFEIARDHLHRMGTYVVVGGVLSPVHDAYGKKELEAATHRIAMIKLSLQNHDWVTLSDWESKQESWSRTKQVLQYHQNRLNAVLNHNLNYDINEDDVNWIPQNIKNGCTGPIQVKLLCGGDLLESFATPGLWSDEDIENIVGQHGIVVISRANTNPLEFIYNSDTLTKYMSNIVIVTEWIRNEISSTKIRRALRRSESVRYLLPDPVIEYIQKYHLFGSAKTKYVMPANNNSVFLTPSPSDAPIDSPSPTNCMYICNNNLFVRQAFDKRIDTVDGYAKKHPGQAVKIITESTGEHKIVREEPSSKEVCKEEVLKGSKSCTNFEEIERKAGLKHSKSNSNLKECDENLIRFIFTKHGIQVISDVETIV